MGLLHAERILTPRDLARQEARALQNQPVIFHLKPNLCMLQ